MKMCKGNVKKKKINQLSNIKKKDFQDTQFNNYDNDKKCRELCIL